MKISSITWSKWSSKSLRHKESKGCSYKKLHCSNNSHYSDDLNHHWNCKIYPICNLGCSKKLEQKWWSTPPEQVVISRQLYQYLVSINEFGCYYKPIQQKLTHKQNNKQHGQTNNKHFTMFSPQLHGWWILLSEPRQVNGWKQVDKLDKHMKNTAMKPIE